MRYLLGAIFILSAWSCSDKIHKSFANNRYIPDSSYHILNDSIQIYHKALGDFCFEENYQKLKKQLKKEKLNNVLVYGKTDLDPYYEYYLLFNPNKSRLNTLAFEHVLDTTLSNDNYFFLGRGLNDKFPRNDFKFISESIKVKGEYRKDITSLNDLLKRNMKTTNYLKAYHDISNYPADTDTDNWFKLQYELTFLSMLGDSQLYRNRLQNYENNYNIDDSITQTILTKGISGISKTRKEILSLTKEARVVMFNENHFYPQHRKLLDFLLEDVYNQGFHYFALEALVHDSLLNSGVQPNVESGFYTKEQNFHRLILSAQKLGFTFVAYEENNPEIDREVGQAENLYKKTFKNDPNAKVLVLAGLDHITEKPDSKGNKWMAQIFKEKYGIDPLTFSQTDLPNYRNVTSAKLLIFASKQLNKKFQRVDYQILNNLNCNPPKGEFKYKNELDEVVQVSLYDNRNWKSKYSYFDKIPEFVYRLEPQKIFSLDIIKENYQLLISNKNGQTILNEEVMISNE